MLPTVKPDHKTKAHLSVRRGRLLMLSAKPKHISVRRGQLPI